MGEDAAAGLGRDVDTHASSYVTLVYDDGEQSRAQKVIMGFLMLLHLRAVVQGSL